LSINAIPTLDPLRNIKTTIGAPVRDPDTPSSDNPVFAASPYFGDEQVWDSKFNAHSPAMDREGRIYFAAQLRSPKNPPPYCARDSSLRSAQLYPLTEKPDGFSQNSRQVTIYDSRSQKFTFVDTCFGTQHLNFGEDASDTLWFSTNTQGKGAVIGWLNIKNFFATGDAADSQGWMPLIVDTNGNGKRDENYNEPGERPDSAKDTRVPLRYFL